MQRLTRFSTGGGYTNASIVSTWTGNIRWARNQVTTAGEVSNNVISVSRSIQGAAATVQINDTTDAALVAAARRAERLLHKYDETENSDLVARLPLEPAVVPRLFSEATYQLDADKRATAALQLTKQAQAAGMLSAGYIEVTAVGVGILDTLGRVRYFPYTQAHYSVTVRDPKGTASGWAGVDWHDWNKIDAAALTANALDKCLQSRNPVGIEPGRYTTILEPQAVCDFVGPLFHGGDISRGQEGSPLGPFFKPPHSTRIGEQVVDERLTISADPMDPELGFAPFGRWANEPKDLFTTPVYHPVTWIKHGVLIHLAFDRAEGIGSMSRNTGLPNSGAFRMTGGETSVKEMIATTKRGLLVTRFDNVTLFDRRSQLYRGYTRDGLWLIENGKVSKAVKNMAFTESVLAALNNLEQLGPPQRAFHPSLSPLYAAPQPVIVPPLKIKDFSFTALIDAV